MENTELHLCVPNARCRRADCRRCLNIQKAKHADKVEIKASKSNNPIYFITLTYKTPSIHNCRQTLRKWRRTKRDDETLGGFWKIEKGKNTGQHIHKILQTAEVPKITDYDKMKIFGLKAVYIQKINDGEIRNVAAYLIKMREVATKSISKNPKIIERQTEMMKLFRKKAEKKTGWLGTWHG